MPSNLVINTAIIYKFLCRLHFLTWQQSCLSCPYLPAHSSRTPSPDYAGTVQPRGNQGRNDPGQKCSGSPSLTLLDHFSSQVYYAVPHTFVPVQRRRHEQITRHGGSFSQYYCQKKYVELWFQSIRQKINFRNSWISQATIFFFESAQEKNLVFSKFRKLSEKVYAKRGRQTPVLQFFQTQGKRFC